MKQGATDAPVVARKVTRHYWDGKGYATRTAAYRAKAKAELVEIVLGPWVERSEEWHSDFDRCNIQTRTWQELENAHPPRPEGANEFWTPSEKEQKEWIDRRFALFFPHVSGDENLERGCGMVGENPPWNLQCHTGQYGDYAFESCRWAQEKWIRRRVTELIAEGK